MWIGYLSWGPSVVFARAKEPKLSAKGLTGHLIMHIFTLNYSLWHPRLETIVVVVINQWMVGPTEMIRVIHYQRRDLMQHKSHARNFSVLG